MARSLDQILKDLDTLTAATQQVDQDLKSLYSQYLEVLGRAAKQQLVLATYHLCTQVYPEAFLSLSVSQRERIQNHLRDIAEQGKTQIVQLAQVAGQDLTIHALEPSNPSSIESNAKTAQGEDDRQADETETLSTEQPPPPTVIAEVPALSQRLASALSLLTAFGSDTVTPLTLAKRHVLLDRQVRAILHKLSGLTNHLLKESQILPDLPDMVIAAAAEAEVDEPGPSAPNLLNVLVEMGNSDRAQSEEETDPEEETLATEEDDPDRNMTHLVAINLRLADIEFADAQTALWRSKIQEKLVKLKQLSSHYQKLQRAKAKAEAEHAWRATWFDN